MKFLTLTLAFFTALFSSCNDTNKTKDETAEEAIDKEIVVSDRTEKIIRLLDENKISEANDFIVNTYDRRADISILFFNYSHSRYNAKKIVEDNRIIKLLGNFWIRSGDRLINGMPDDESYAIIHKKTMRLVQVGGEYEVSHLLKNSQTQ